MVQAVPNPSSILLREPRLLLPGAKPIVPVVLDRDHPYTQELRIADIMKPAGFNRARQEWSSSINGIRYIDGYPHVNENWSFGTNEGINCGRQRFLESTSKVTMMAKVKLTSLTADQRIFSKWAGSDGYLFWFDTSGVGMTHTYSFATGNSSTIDRAQTGNNTAVTDTWQSIAGVYKGASFVKIYLDGVLMQTNTTSINNVNGSTSTDAYIAGTGSNAGVPYIEYMYVWYRILDDGEIADLSNDPYQIWMPAA